MNNENKKPILFTVHARNRLQERKITESEAIDAVYHGKSIGWREGKAVYEYKTVIIVLDIQESAINVITVFRSNRTFEERINNIPAPYKWLKSAGYETFINQGYLLLEKGLSEYEVISVLEELYQAVCHEYGE